VRLLLRRGPWERAAEVTCHAHHASATACVCLAGFAALPAPHSRPLSSSHPIFPQASRCVSTPARTHRTHLPCATQRCSLTPEFCSKDDEGYHQLRQAPVSTAAAQRRQRRARSWARKGTGTPWRSMEKPSTFLASEESALRSSKGRTATGYSASAGRIGGRKGGPPCRARRSFCAHVSRCSRRHSRRRPRRLCAMAQPPRALDQCCEAA
jgi:hypothetical protein